MTFVPFGKTLLHTVNNSKVLSYNSTVFKAVITGNDIVSYRTEIQRKGTLKFRIKGRWNLSMANEFWMTFQSL